MFISNDANINKIVPFQDNASYNRVHFTNIVWQPHSLISRLARVVVPFQYTKHVY